LEAWQQSRPERAAHARGACGRRRDAIPYYAYEDLAGEVHWLFCNGAQVSTRGVEREVELPTDARAPRVARLARDALLKSSSKYPGELIDRPPPKEHVQASSK
jgi:hypothetical protein